MAKSSKNPRPSKPKKPRPDFPLFPHATGRWAKKIRGKTHYFGKWADDPHGEAALNKYLDERDDLYAGRKPRANRDGVTVGRACDHFLHTKKARVESGELTEATWRDYQITAKRVVKVLGRDRLVDDLRPEDFDALRRDFAKTCGLVAIRNQITHARMIFNYAYKAGLIDCPIRFGANFSRPSAQSIRRQRTPRMFEAVEVRRMLDAAKPTMKAMILLGVNCGFGCADVGRLPKSAIDLKTGWVTFPRPKTGTERRVPLWAETIEAVNAALAKRPKPTPENETLVFITRTGGAWHKDSTRYMTDQFSKFLKAIDLNAESQAAKEGTKPPAKLYRKGRGFYALRHVFETIGGESRDQVAVDAIMGHERGDMASIYRERISDDRLEYVVNVVREWLFSEPTEATEDEHAVLRFPGVG
ncbi:MAG: tyrosine-type recombinase/integrase [Pirellulaceae bacterium]